MGKLLIVAPWPILQQGFDRSLLLAPSRTTRLLPRCWRSGIDQKFLTSKIDQHKRSGIEAAAFHLSRLPLAKVESPRHSSVAIPDIAALIRATSPTVALPFKRDNDSARLERVWRRGRVDLCLNGRRHREELRDEAIQNRVRCSGLLRLRSQ